MFNFLKGTVARTASDARRTRALHQSVADIGLHALEPRLLQTNASVGVNVEGVADFGRSFMFADAMKSARHFGSVNSPWDEAAPVDASGWPVGDAAATVIVLDNTGPTPIRIDGTYHFSAIGKINVSPVASNAYVTNWKYDAASDITTADVVVNAGATQLHLNFTGDPDGAKDIHLWRPGTGPGQTFTPEFLQSFDGVQTLRMMDFARTNTVQVTEWADRAKVTDAIQSTEQKGAAWEYAIELANTLHKDLWVNVPIGASDDYVAKMATLFHNTLDPSLHLYVEYSNEVWNYTFQQFHVNYSNAQAEVAANPGDLNFDNANNTYQYAWRRVAKRLVEVKDIFADVYGNNAINDTVRPVLASQIGWSFVLKDQLAYLEHRFGTDLSHQIYAVAGAPYLSIGDTLSNSSGLTVDQIFVALNQNLADSQASIQKYEAMAIDHRLNLLYYEGGIDIQGDTGGNFWNAKLPSNYDPRMYDLVRGYLINAFQNGADGVVYYSQISSYTTWGSWGLTDSVQALDSAKMQGFRSVASQETPAASTGIGLPAGFGGVTFDAGTYLLDFYANHGRGGAIEGTGRGAQYSYLLNVTNPGEYAIQLATATPAADGLIEVYIDGISVGQLRLPPTSGITTYANTASLSLTGQIGALSKGHHTLTLKVLSGYLNIQSLTIGAGGYQAPPPVQPQIPLPVAPDNVAVSAKTSSQVTLTWNNVALETGYKVARSTDGSNWTSIALLGADVTTFTDTGLSSGTQYFYRVLATNSGGDSPYSATVTATTSLVAPTNLAATALTPTSIKLTWSPVTGTASYLVQRSLNGKTWTNLTRVSRATTTFTDQGVSPNTSYSYRIYAVALDGTLSEVSNPVTVRTKKK
jgi:hypothetical protein